MAFPNLELFDGLQPITLTDFNKSTIMPDGKLKDYVGILVEDTYGCNYVYVERKLMPASYKCNTCAENPDVSEYRQPHMMLTEVMEKNGKFMAGTAFYICNEEIEQEDGKIYRCGGNIYPMYPIEDLIEDLNNPVEALPFIVANVFKAEDDDDEDDDEFFSSQEKEK
jgi:hypothetical protein